MVKISVSNQKSRIGKTTVILNLAKALTVKGYRVLLLDLDPQSNLTYTLGLENLRHSINDVIQKKADIQKVIFKIDDRIDLIPSSMNLSSVDFEFNRIIGWEFLLKESLENLNEDYDFLLIDTPSNLGVLTVNALVASKYVLIPTQSELFALQGANQMMEGIRLVKKRFNAELEILGVVVTMFSRKQSLSQEALEKTRDIYNYKVFDTVIREDEHIPQALNQGGNIFDLYPECRAVKDYLRLTDELTKRIK